MITGMDFVSLPAKDLVALRKFYEEELGFPVAEYGGEPWTEFDLGAGPALSLIRAADMGMDDAPVKTGVILISVPDLETKLEQLKAKGYADADAKPFESPVCHGVAVRDAYGNALMLHRRKADPGLTNAIDAVVLPTTDPKALGAWYVAQLGLEAPTMDLDSWVEFTLPDDSAFALGDPRVMGIAADPNTTGGIALRTPDLEAVFEQLKAGGFATQDEILETEVCHMAFVKDLHGNALILHRHKP